MPITIGPEARPGWIGPLTAYVETLRQKEIERERKKAAKEAERGQIAGAVGQLAGNVVGAAVGGPILGGGTQGALAGANLGGSFGQGVGSLVGGDIPGAAQGAAQGLQQVQQLIDRRALAEIGKTLANPDADDKTVSEAIGRLLEVDPQAGLSIVTQMRRDDAISSRQERSDLGYDFRERRRFVAGQVAKGHHPGFANLRADVVGFQRPPPFDPNETAYSDPELQAKLDQAGLMVKPRVDRDALNSLKRIDTGLAESKTDYLQGRITQEQYESERQQWKELANNVQLAPSIEPKPVPLQQQVATETYHDPNTDLIWSKVVRNGEEKFVVSKDLKEQQANLAAAETKRVKAELDRTAKVVEINQKIAPELDFAGKPYGWMPPHNRERRNYLIDKLPYSDETKAVLGFDKNIPMPDDAPEVQQAKADAAYAADAAAQERVRAAIQQREVIERQVNNARETLDLLVIEHGKDPSKWGMDKADGLEAAALIVGAGRRVDKPIAEALIVEIKTQIEGQAMTPEVAAMLGRLAIMAEVGE